MKFALNCRQTPEYLRKADQILVDFRDRKAMTDYIVDYPEKDIILIQHIGDELVLEDCLT
jgi:hypothetical protein